MADFTPIRLGAHRAHCQVSVPPELLGPPAAVTDEVRKAREDAENNRNWHRLRCLDGLLLTPPPAGL